ncbi:Transcription initiation factor IIF subunit alpha [Fusarium oxysporum f. sp. cubense race 1]|uniref:Transcription initiation factor IIF subunit alpha n=1 Tax=Fusarium oxysporum f. sp. cubense (strain race 1) TaxID=1229664 RepID=N4UYN4_FUSC1|nr:Transcription initiation factor IIF subunit alpha [Fusarium oxysporum f. sp. cubense race 1]
MSAPPPPGNPPANAPGYPNGAPKKQKPNPLRPLRKNPKANPLVSRRPPPRPTAPSASGRPNGTKPNIEEIRRQNGGWSEPPPPKYNDIPIMTTKKDLLDGIRYHMMKFTQSKAGGKSIDPTDQDDFARPVTLHRRDARQPPPGRAVKTEAPEAPKADEEEVERQAQRKAEREAQRAIDQAKIAPVAKDPNPKRPKKQKEEKTTFNRAPKTETAKKASDLRYEEALPWHLEDAEGKNVWVGNFVDTLSGSNVAFMIDQSVFRMIPLEKWYKFTSKPPFQTYDIDEVEAFMSKKVDVGRWVMRDEEKKAGRKDLEATRKMFYGSGPMVKTESATFKAASRSEKLEHDEIDMSGDEFQDDDEAPMFERNDDEDTKDSKDRIRREQLGANLFGEGDEQEVDKELDEQLREEILRQKLGKATKKALIKRDREDIYESDDSEENPWSSSSDDNSSDEEEEEDKKDDDKKEVNKDDKNQSGSLKRAGSPALSESSGNESSRKKLKKNVTSATGSRSGTPLLQGGAARRPTAAGSGSDGEATAGEMSDGAAPKRKKLKLVSSSARGTPSASRAGSPNPTQGAASPGSPGASAVEPSEILDKIPAEGITVNELIKLFNHRLGDRPGQMSKTEWIQLVKKLCDYGPDKRLRRRS